MNNDAAIKRFIKFLANDLYSKEQLKDSECYKEILDVYRSNYRHSYSDMLTTLMEIQEKTQNNSGIGILSENLEIIKLELISNQSDENIRRKLHKFYDHLVLEITRLMLLEKAHERQRALVSQNQKTSKELLEARKKIEKLSEQTFNVKTEFVTILSVFAAIILAFSGGLGLNNEILRNMHQVPIYKLSTMAIIIGFVLFNTIFGLMHIVSKIIGKDLSHKCNQCGNSNCDTRDKDTACNPFTKVKLRYPYVYYVNTFFVIGLGVIFCAWLIDIKIIVAYIRNGVEWNLYNQIECLFMYGVILGALIWGGHWYLRKSRSAK